MALSPQLLMRRENTAGGTRNSSNEGVMGFCAHYPLLEV